LRRSNSFDRALSERIKRLIVDSRRYIYIAVQTIDGTFSDDIAKAARRNVEVKIIISPLKKEWIHPKSAKMKVLADLSPYCEIKIKNDWHGRMIIVDDKLIIGSLDLDNQGLTVQDNLVIETDEETAVERAKEIFYELASESQPHELPSA
jgi:phosphatidylserine/phosphatidylglycerophosphate/cardiolipin synthase-like enzyme